MKNLLKYFAAGTVALQLATPAFAAYMRLKFAGVFPANQLGSGEALLEDVARGNIDFASAFIYADTDQRLEFLSMPFLVSD
jgi:TRAP-type C4-dicarboxylate transport system substrate-binding protein